MSKREPKIVCVLGGATVTIDAIGYALGDDIQNIARRIVLDRLRTPAIDALDHKFTSSEGDARVFVVHHLDESHECIRASGLELRRQ